MCLLGDERSLQYIRHFLIGSRVHGSEPEVKLHNFNVTKYAPHLAILSSNKYRWPRAKGKGSILEIARPVHCRKRKLNAATEYFGRLWRTK